MNREQQKKVTRKRLTPVVLGLGAALTLTGCGAGQISQTAEQVSAVDGDRGQSGKVDIHNAELAAPTDGHSYQAGASAPISASIINGGNQPDRLLSVSSPVAASGQISGDTTLPGGMTLNATGQSQQGQGQANQQGQPGQQGQLPPEIAEMTGQKPVRITLNGFKQEVRPGLTIPVTFSFQNSGPVTLDMPIASPEGPRPPAGE